MTRFGFLLACALAASLGAQSLTDRFKEVRGPWELQLERGDASQVRKGVEALLALVRQMKKSGCSDGEISNEIEKYKEMKVEGNSIRLFFNYTDGGLVAKGGDLTYFTIAGEGKKFVSHWDRRWDFLDRWAPNRRLLIEFEEGFVV